MTHDQQPLIEANRPASETLITLQALRGIAALLVAYFHAVLWQAVAASGHTLLAYNTSVWSFGAAGVDMFFVLSGFIMTLVAARYQAPRGAARFFLKRAIRVAPLYWLSSVICVILLANVRIHPGKLFSSFFFWPAYENGRTLLPYNGAGWSLSFEMYFYSAVALAILVCRPAVVMRRVVMVFAGMTIVGLALPRILDVQMFILNPIILEFVLGCCVGLLYQRISGDARTRYWLPLIGLGIAGFLLTIIFGTGSLAPAKYTLNCQLSLHRVACWGIPSTLLVAGLVFGNHRLHRYVPCWLATIGDASYSIYLTQGITFALFEMLYRHHRLAGLGVSIVLSFAAAVLVGLGQYRFIERGLTVRLNRLADAVLSKPSIRSRWMRRRLGPDSAVGRYWVELNPPANPGSNVQ